MLALLLAFYWVRLGLVEVASSTLCHSQCGKELIKWSNVRTTFTSSHKFVSMGDVSPLFDERRRCITLLILSMASRVMWGIFSVSVLHHGFSVTSDIGGYLTSVQ